MKKTIFFIFSICLLLPFSGNSQTRTKIGVSAALTGDASTYGIDVKNALLFANKKLANNQYDLIIEDDKCSGQGAVTVAQKFINIDKVKHVVGLVCSSTVLASAPVYEKAKVLTITPSASAEAISHAGDYIFRTWPSDLETVKILHEYVSKQHQKLGIVSEETEYAQGFLKGMQEKSLKSGLKVFSETFLTENNDFRSLLGKLQQKGIDGLFLNTQTERTFLAVLRQVKQLKINVPIYAVYWPGSSSFLKAAGEMANDIIYVDAPTVEEALSEGGMKVYQEFIQEFGPPQYSGFLFATTYEAFRTLHTAIQSEDDPRKTLYSTKLDGLFGSYSFDQNGDIVGVPMMLKRIEQGKVKIISSS